MRDQFSLSLNQFPISPLFQYHAAQYKSAGASSKPVPNLFPTSSVLVVLSRSPISGSFWLSWNGGERSGDGSIYLCAPWHCERTRREKGGRSRFGALFPPRSLLAGGGSSLRSLSRRVRHVKGWRQEFRPMWNRDSGSLTCKRKRRNAVQEEGGEVEKRSVFFSSENWRRTASLTWVLKVHGWRLRSYPWANYLSSALSVSRKKLPERESEGDCEAISGTKMRPCAVSWFAGGIVSTADLWIIHSRRYRRRLEI